MKKGIYILAVILFLLGTTSILAGFGIIKIISSVHHLRYELVGALLDLLAIGGTAAISINNLKTKLQRASTFFNSGIFEEGIYTLAVILFLLGTTSILAGCGIIKIISSVYHLRYELVGALLDLLAIGGTAAISMKNIKTKLQRARTFFNSGIFEERKFRKSEPFLVVLFIGFFTISAFLLVLWITPYGSGVNPDSLTYFGGAKNLLSGQGYTMDGSPITHFPPLYSLFLAAMTLLGDNIVQAARLLNAIFYGINAGLIALIVYLATGRKFLPSTLAVLFFLSSGRLIELYTSALSEPLFITLSLAAILLLWLYVAKLKLSSLITFSIFFGFAVIARFEGIFFLPALYVIVFFYGRGHNFKQRFWNTILCLSLTCTPMTIFFAGNIISNGSATDRIFIAHPIPISQYMEELRNLGINFLAPISLPVWVMPVFWGLVAVILIAQIFLIIKRHSRNIRWHSIDTIMPVTWLLFFGFYLVLLYVSITFFDASTPVDARVLSPILCITIVGVFSAIWMISKTLKASLVWCGFLLCAALSISLKTPDAIGAAAAIQENGSGYTSRQWLNSETIAFVKLLPDDLEIYSNGPDVLGFLNEKKSISIPNQTFSVTREANSLYTIQIDAMCKLIKEKGAVLVYFNQITWRWYLPTQEEVKATCNLPVLRRFDDGIVFGEVSVK